MRSLLSLVKHPKNASRPMEDDTGHVHWLWTDIYPTSTSISHCRYSSTLHRRIVKDLNNLNDTHRSILRLGVSAQCLVQS
jgi:hypothetical protein